MRCYVAALGLLSLAVSTAVWAEGAGTPNCGTDYLLPGLVARHGSHSFMIIGRTDPDHVLAAHRSGTPPHNHQFLLNVRLDPEEMAAYERIAKVSKTLPAFTTIYFDERGQQQARSFFCLRDLPRIFGEQQRAGDEFEQLFPIRASLQQDADHEGSFPIKPSVVKGAYLSIERADVELLVDRYLPEYLSQADLRQAIKAQGKSRPGRLGHAPITADEAPGQAAQHPSYLSQEGGLAAPGRFCSRNYYLKKTPVPETIHSFLLFGADAKNELWAVHYYGPAPQNFQTVLRLKLSDAGMKLWRQAQQGARVPPLFQTQVAATKGAPLALSTFCMDQLRTLLKSPSFAIRGTLYRDSQLAPYRLGEPVGTLRLGAGDVEVLVNRRLESLLDPLAVAEDVLGPPP